MDFKGASAQDSRRPASVTCEPMAGTFKYHAFLSYSHADTASARRVHRRIEGFQIGKDLVGQTTPAGPVPQTLRVFRDRHDFDAGGSLAQQTITALDGFRGQSGH